uniref:Uncharacterized protein n=1 Tax=Panagrellus redivivus TaxID=6233 RepID=A0A7E4W0E4_PANRE
MLPSSLLSTWKKIVLAACLTVIALFAYFDYSQRAEFADTLLLKLDAYKKEVESLTTQLILFTQHKKKLEAAINNYEAEQKLKLDEFKNQIKKLQLERADWQQKFEECSAKAVLKVPMVSDFDVARLQEENSQKESEIHRLKSEVEKLQTLQNETSVHMVGTGGATASNAANGTENKPLELAESTLTGA